MTHDESPSVVQTMTHDESTSVAQTMTHNESLSVVQTMTHDESPSVVQTMTHDESLSLADSLSVAEKLLRSRKTKQPLCEHLIQSPTISVMKCSLQSPPPKGYVVIRPCPVSLAIQGTFSF